MRSFPPSVKTPTVESRIDTLARAVEEIRTVSTRMDLIISTSLTIHPHAYTAYLPVRRSAKFTKVEYRLQWA